MARGHIAAGLLLLLVVGAIAVTVANDDDDMQRAQAQREARRLKQQQATGTSELKPETKAEEAARLKALGEQQAKYEQQQKAQAEQQRRQQQQQKAQAQKAKPQKAKTPTPEEVKAEKERKEKQYENKRQQTDLAENALRNKEATAVAKHEDLLASQDELSLRWVTDAKVLLAAGNVPGALELLRKAAEVDNQEGLYLLGSAYEEGVGVERNFSRAFELYQRSASFGFPAGQRALAFFLETGKGAEPNVPLALLYETFSARSKDVEAMHRMAYRYIKGYGVVASCNMAAKYYRSVCEEVYKEVEERGYDIGQTVEVALLADDSAEDKIAKDEDTLEYIHFAAQQGNPAFQGDLGRIYLFGLYRSEKDYQLAAYYLKLASDQGDSKSAAFLGYMHEKGLGMDVDLDKASDLYQASADLESPFGMYFLGKMYKSGISETLGKKYATAITWFQKGMGKGHYDCAVELGIMYYNGEGVQKNYETAFAYFKNAALHDNAHGQLLTAKLLQFGIGTAQSCPTAVQYYNKLALKGSWRTDFEEAYSLYLNGDVDSALLIYEQLADRGFVEAQANVAYIYDHGMQGEQFIEHYIPLVNGTGAEAHHRRALKYYRKAADLGNEMAYLRLGDFYYYGLGGLEADEEQAAAYYRQISTSSAQAMFNLGYMHHFGEGVTQDLPLAKRFYDLSLASEPAGRLPVTLAQLHLAGMYAYQMFEEDKLEQLLWEALEYCFPFTMSLTEESDVPVAPAAPAVGEDGEEISFWDQEVFYGLAGDTVALYLLGGVLLFLFTVRQNIQAAARGRRRRR